MLGLKLNHVSKGGPDDVMIRRFRRFMFKGNWQIIVQ